MASLVFSEAFVEDMLQVVLESKRAEILNSIALLERVPEIGSRIIPSSIRERYGSSVRKLVVDPFDIVYEHDRANDCVHVLDLLHQRAAICHPRG